MRYEATPEAVELPYHHRVIPPTVGTSMMRFNSVPGFLGTRDAHVDIFPNHFPATPRCIIGAGTHPAKTS
jgi:hypothetical protein